MRYAAVGGPNQVVSASASPSWLGLPPRPHIRQAESTRRWAPGPPRVPEAPTDRRIGHRSAERIVGINEVVDDGGRRDHVAQQLQSFSRDRRGGKLAPVMLPPGRLKLADKAQFDWVAAA